MNSDLSRRESARSMCPTLHSDDRHCVRSSAIKLDTTNQRSHAMRLADRKIGILIEGDFFENEIFYYEFRFAEEGADVHFLSRLWGNPGITFNGHEFRRRSTATKASRT